MNPLRALKHLLNVLLVLILDMCRFLFLTFQSGMELRAENLFLRKLLAFYTERKIRARQVNDGTRIVLAFLSKFFAWKDALVIVKPETLMRWHRKEFRLFWRWKNKRRGRPRLPIELQNLIRQMAKQNTSWGEEPIAAELPLKIGIRVAPRTVTRYMPNNPETRDRLHSERWVTFVKNHAKAFLACDFFVTVTATFRILCVLVTQRDLRWRPS